MNEALSISSIARAIKTLYESIKSRSLSHLTIHELPLEVQLPPYLDSLLHNEDDFDSIEDTYREDNERNSWGRELSFAWRLPSLEPWKSLLLLDGPAEKDWSDVCESLRDSNVREEDTLLAEQLIKFLGMADVTLPYVHIIRWTSVVVT